MRKGFQRSTIWKQTQKRSRSSYKRIQKIQASIQCITSLALIRFCNELKGISISVDLKESCQEVLNWTRIYYYHLIRIRKILKFIKKNQRAQLGKVAVETSLNYKPSFQRVREEFNIMKSIQSHEADVDKIFKDSKVIGQNYNELYKQVFNEMQDQKQTMLKIYLDGPNQFGFDIQEGMDVQYSRGEHMRNHQPIQNSLFQKITQKPTFELNKKQKAKRISFEIYVILTLKYFRVGRQRQQINSTRADTIQSVRKKFGEANQPF